jgi:hypothetical protein
MPQSPEIDELRHRVKAKRRMLEAKLEEAKADAAGAANDTVRDLRSTLRELDEKIGDGWDSLTEDAAARLNRWLKEH